MDIELENKIKKKIHFDRLPFAERSKGNLVSEVLELIKEERKRCVNIVLSYKRFASCTPDQIAEEISHGTDGAVNHDVGTKADNKR